MRSFHLLYNIHILYIRIKNELIFNLVIIRWAFIIIFKSNHIINSRQTKYLIIKYGKALLLSTAPT